MPIGSKHRGVSRGMQATLTCVLALLALAAVVLAIVPKSGAVPSDAKDTPPAPGPAPVALVICDSQAHGGQGVTKGTSWVPRGSSKPATNPK